MSQSKVKETRACDRLVATNSSYPLHPGKSSARKSVSARCSALWSENEDGHGREGAGKATSHCAASRKLSTSHEETQERPCPRGAHPQRNHRGRQWARRASHGLVLLPR